MKRYFDGSIYLLCLFMCVALIYQLFALDGAFKNLLWTIFALFLNLGFLIYRYWQTHPRH
ncbi:MAG: hypothetical protein KDD33_06750 [Bdellovibrionales bacterium]|nr:hypothetical protein [Bdellovibrionales bacterium]